MNPFMSNFLASTKGPAPIPWEHVVRAAQKLPKGALEVVKSPKGTPKQSVPKSAAETRQPISRKGFEALNNPTPNMGIGAATQSPALQQYLQQQQVLGNVLPEVY